MKSLLPHFLAGASLSLLCWAGVAQGSSPAREVPLTNPLLQAWKGPYGGVPPFDQVQVSHFKPALETAMAEQLVSVEKIAGNPAPPSFDNTLAAMEGSGRTLEQVNALYNVWSSAMSSDEFQAVEREMAPKLAAFQDQITQNEKLFSRIAWVYEHRDAACKTPEQKRLAWLYYNNFVRAGARLDATAKKRVAAINERLAALYTSFTQNVLAEESGYKLILEKEADLAGLPPSVVSAAAAAAETQGQKGKWAILNTRSMVEPFLSYAHRRDLREKVWRTFYARGDHGDARDNKGLITEILKLRAERAKVLGYATHAHWRVEDSMAKTPQNTLQLMETVWEAARARVLEEVADMQAIADKEKAGIRIEPWDYRYYAEKVRQAKYDLDANEVKAYLQMDKLREGMFYVAKELFDLHFTPATNVPVYHPDVRVWEVREGTGNLIGLWYFDPYARPEKQSGAWMSAYRNQERFEREITTIVSNNSNFAKGAATEPTLVSWDDARTLFHEFGHALHGLCSSVSYPSLSGTSVARDYVEFPSQILEHWLLAPQVLNQFALHYQTGKPMPKELVEKLERSSKFNQGFATVEFLAAALVDMQIHLAGDTTIDAAAFEKAAVEKIRMPKEVVLRHRLPHFQHIFANDGYSAGYYSYLWADTLSADAYEAFVEAQGPFDKQVAAKLKKFVFSAGNTVDPAEAYRAFRGRDPGIGALMRDRGFPEPAKGATGGSPAGK